MFDVAAQLDYLREIQNSFAHGSGKLDLLQVFGIIISYVLPVLLAVLLWRYRSLLKFYWARSMASIFHGAAHGDIEKYLTNKAVMLEVHALESHGIGKLLCHVRISSVFSGKMALEVVKSEPTALQLRGRKIICLCKPFIYGGERLNSFVTYVAFVRKRGALIRKLVLLSPLRYRFTIRRKHTRQKVTQQDMFRVKAWDGRRRSNFWQHRPDIQTLSRATTASDKMRLRVGNISPGGVRLFIEKPNTMSLPPLTANQTLILRISIQQPKTKKFVYFTVLGTIRSRFKTKNGSIGVGIQFTAVAEKVPGETGGYRWRSVKDEVPALAQFLKRLGR